jgi:hypothetical protein
LRPHYKAGRLARLDPMDVMEWKCTIFVSSAGILLKKIWRQYENIKVE